MINRLTLAVTIALLSVHAIAENTSEVQTVIGPRNLDLYYGAEALKDGNGDEGVRLTLQGLKTAQGAREVQMAHANLCVGYLLRNQPLTALQHCNWVLERDDRHWRSYSNRALVYLRLDRFEDAQADISKGEELNPNSKSIKEVKGLYLDEVEPVSERILIDERRQEPDAAAR